MSRFTSVPASPIIEKERGNGNGAGPRAGEETGPQRTGSPIGVGGWGRRSPIIGGTGFDGASTSLHLLTSARSGEATQFSSLFGQLFGKSIPTYRFMRTQPTLAVARAIIFNPIISNRWVAEPTRENVPVAWVNFVREEIVPHRRAVVKHALRGLDFGNSKFENVWRYARGFWTYDFFKPLVVDQNSIIADKVTGAFLGIRPRGGAADGRDDLGPQKAWVFTYDGEAGDLAGRSRFENVRTTAWADWLDTLLKSQKLRHKLAGIIPIFYHPPGGFEEPEGSGNYITYQAACDAAAAALMRGDYVTIEHLGFSTTDIRANPDLLKAGAITLDFYNGGDYSSAQEGMLKQLEYDDRNLMRGMLRPERQALEARSGTRADAQSHSDTGTEDGETLAAEIDEQFTNGPVAEALAVNFGEDARGAVRVKTGALTRAKAATNERIILALVKAGMSRAFAETLNIDDMLKEMDLPQLLAFALAIKRADKSPKPTKPGAGQDETDDEDEPEDERDDKPEPDETDDAE